MIPNDLLKKLKELSRRIAEVLNKLKDEESGLDYINDWVKQYIIISSEMCGIINEIDTRKQSFSPQERESISTACKRMQLLIPLTDFVQQFKTAIQLIGEPWDNVVCALEILTISLVPVRPEKWAEYFRKKLSDPRFDDNDMAHIYFVMLGICSDMPREEIESNSTKCLMVFAGRPAILQIMLKMMDNE